VILGEQSAARRDGGVVLGIGAWAAGTQAPLARLSARSRSRRGAVPAQRLLPAPAGVENAAARLAELDVELPGLPSIGRLGVGFATAPGIAGTVAKFLLGAGWTRISHPGSPGVATSPLSDADLAEVMNWMLWRFDKEHLPASFQPYTAAEIAPLRARPLRLEASQMRSSLLSQAEARCRGQMTLPFARQLITVTAMNERREIDGLDARLSEILAALSHELRNPLNAILGWATILTRRGDLPEPVMQGLQAIERNSRLQARMIANLVDYAAVSAGPGAPRDRDYRSVSGGSRRHGGSRRRGARRRGHCRGFLRRLSRCVSRRTRRGWSRSSAIC
jgi:signal transduction histidine kinase